MLFSYETFESVLAPVVSLGGSVLAPVVSLGGSVLAPVLSLGGSSGYTQAPAADVPLKSHYGNSRLPDHKHEFGIALNELRDAETNSTVKLRDHDGSHFLDMAIYEGHRLDFFACSDDTVRRFNSVAEALKAGESPVLRETLPESEREVADVSDNVEDSPYCSILAPKGPGDPFVILEDGKVFGRVRSTDIGKAEVVVDNRIAMTIEGRCLDADISFTVRNPCGETVGVAAVNETTNMIEIKPSPGTDVILMLAVILSLAIFTQTVPHSRVIVEELGNDATGEANEAVGMFTHSTPQHDTSGRERGYSEASSGSGIGESADAEHKAALIKERAAAATSALRHLMNCCSRQGFKPESETKESKEVVTF